ncbi:unnamed protein product [Diplocarpon coronariae]
MALSERYAPAERPIFVPTTRPRYPGSPIQATRPDGHHAPTQHWLPGEQYPNYRLSSSSSLSDKDRIPLPPSRNQSNVPFYVPCSPPAAAYRETRPEYVIYREPPTNQGQNQGQNFEYRTHPPSHPPGPQYHTPSSPLPEPGALPRWSDRRLSPHLPSSRERARYPSRGTQRSYSQSRYPRTGSGTSRRAPYPAPMTASGRGRRGGRRYQGRKRGGEGGRVNEGRYHRRDLGA